MMISKSIGMRLLWYVVFLLSVSKLKSQPGNANMTPVQQLNLASKAVEVPAKFASIFPPGKTLKIPAGYGVKLYYAGGLNKPRFLSFDANNVLHVADQLNGAIYALPDKNHDGIADTIIVAALGFKDSHDVTFYKGSMYVTDSIRVWKCEDADHNGVYESRSIFIDSIGYGAAKGGHHTRTIVFDSVAKKAYLSIGSSCNVCRENAKAIIEVYNEDGSGKRLMASGIRNAVGLAIHPVTRTLWANNNGSDLQGNEIPPEWIDIIRQDGFYGHPLAYGNQVWFNFNASKDYQALLPITASDSFKVSKMIEPAALIRAHSAPMALTFLNNSFPSGIQNGMLSALHGSWNSPQSFRGYKVVYLHLSNSTDTTVNFVSDFIDGFLTDTMNRIYWGRPVGLAVDTEGSIYMSSDEVNKFILKIYPLQGGGIQTKREQRFQVYPNPTKNELNITMNESWINGLDHLAMKYQVISCDGKIVLSGNVVSETFRIDISALSTGIYYLQIGNETAKLIKW